MYYPDLTCYRINFSPKKNIVYPNLRNIGWLDASIDYEKGNVPNPLVQKLKEILFFKNKNIEDERNGKFDEDKAILVHTMFIRGSAYECQFCKESKTILIEPNGLQYYSGKNPLLLGTNEIYIPSLKKKEFKEFYVLPTMVYHYITAHQYKPPQEFLDALEAFDLNQPFNLEKEYGDEIELKMTEIEVNNFVPELGLSNFEKYDEEDDDDEDDDEWICRS